MQNLVFVTGGFSSGSTLLFTLFRQSGEFHSLYEPLHEHLPVYLYAPLRAYGHHYHVSDYFAEYRGFSAIPRLFDTTWGRRRFFLGAEDAEPRLFRYLSYLIGTAFGRQAKVMLQFNRATFRLGWLRARFPDAAVIHIARDRERQWNSIVRRSQLDAGRTDVGQETPGFNGMGIATWCDDLAEHFPELRAEASRSGRERFERLWDLAAKENRRYADLSIAYEDLTTRFNDVFGDVWRAAGATSDWRRLEQWVVPPDRQRPIRHPNKFVRKLTRAYDRLRWRYAEARVKLAGGGE